MSEDDISRIYLVAEQKLQTFEPSTKQSYRRFLKKWEKFTRRKNLLTYDVNDVTRWHDRPGNQARAAAFPIRCVEMVQAMEPEVVGDDFFVPQGLWNGAAIVYRKEVVKRAVIEKVIACAMADIEETKALTRETIVPFVVLMAVRTGMNTESLQQLRRDSSKPSNTGSYVVQWEKGRSGKTLSAEYFPMPWGPREIVERVQELTIPGNFFGSWKIPGNTPIEWRVLT
jgi:hypothetical protein